MSVIKRDPNKEGWEKSDFPIVCETCLGDNPYVRMTKAEFDKECKVCARPFTVFRWRPGSKARYKKTEICQTCSKLKNVCQVCLLDLEYGLPVQVRDSTLPNVEQIPLSDVNREYFADQAERRVEQGLISFGKAGVKAAGSSTLVKLARVKPYYKRNRAHICSFYVRGECNRGDECPYRHEMPEEGELSQQNIKDRYYGVNDPVAKKLLNRVDQFKTLLPPDDPDVTTLYLSALPLTITESTLRDYFYGFGEIKWIKIVNKAGQSPQQQQDTAANPLVQFNSTGPPCGFVTYTNRADAEAAAEALFNKLVIDGCHVRLSWAKPTLPPTASDPSQYENSGQGMNNYFSLGYPSQGGRPYYPSMDPNMMGSKPVTMLNDPQYPSSSSSSTTYTMPSTVLVPNPAP